MMRLLLSSIFLIVGLSAMCGTRIKNYEIKARTYTVVDVCAKPKNFWPICFSTVTVADTLYVDCSNIDKFANSIYSSTEVFYPATESFYPYTLLFPIESMVWSSFGVGKENTQIVNTLFEKVCKAVRENSVVYEYKVGEYEVRCTAYRITGFWCEMPVSSYFPSNDYDYFQNKDDVPESYRTVFLVYPLCSDSIPDFRILPVNDEQKNMKR